MTETKYLNPPEWDDSLNVDVADYEAKMDLLRNLNEETDNIGIAIENSHYIDSGIRKCIGILLDRLKDDNIKLESRIENLRQSLIERGVDV